MTKVLLILGLLIGLTVKAQQPQVVQSEDIVDLLTGERATRGIIVRQRRTPIGQSIAVRVNFEFDSRELAEDALYQLDELVAALLNPRLAGYGFRVIGHTDAKGDAHYNMRLSLQRARVVRDYLETAGVSKVRLQVEGKGEQELLFPHRPNDEANRRVEIINEGIL